METLTRLKLISMVATLALLTGCGNDTGFTLGGEQSVFRQSVTRTQVKVDILWVIDNSGSMATSQAQVANSFNSFIQGFQSTNFDYQMAVTTTDAWCGDFGYSGGCIRPINNANGDFKTTGPPGIPQDGPTGSGNLDNIRRFRDGTPATSQTGVRILKPDTPDLANTFITNMTQGTRGSGSERSFESLVSTLSYAGNSGDNFPRQDALLAVIILTDEEDSSAQAPDPGNDPDWFADKDYYDFLYNLTNSTEDNLNFMVNTIGAYPTATIPDCVTHLETDGFTGRSVAARNEALSVKTGGYVGSLCADDFNDVLDGIADTIIDKSTAFKLNREPALDTMVVKIDGVVIPMDPVNGWTYDSSTMLVSFHGSAIPGSESVVEITFDPAGLK